MTDRRSLEDLADRVGQRLLETGERLVLAESCTGGLAAAMLAGVPGISRSLCGSFVVYRDATKTAWLSIPPDFLRDFTSVSPEATAAIGRAAFERTPEATVVVAITGHLGPGVAADLDGRIYVEIHRRDGLRIASEHRLPKAASAEAEPRRNRQRAATAFLFERLLAALG